MNLITTKGFSLIEVLISIVVLNVGFFALIDMQWQALKQIRLLQIQQRMQYRLMDLTELLSKQTNAITVLQQWQQNCEQQFPQWHVTYQQENTDCWRVTLQWQHHQAIHQINQIVCSDH